jgi:hypothetical protein
MNPPPDPNGPPVATTPPAVPPTSPAQYEFDESQNKVIDDLASSLVWVGVPLGVLAILYGFNAVIHFIRVGRDTAQLIPAGIAVLGAIFFYVLASWLRKAAESFSRVTHTAGFDITHLMNGLRNLGKLFRILALLVKVYLVLLAVLLIALVVSLFFVKP